VEDDHETHLDKDVPVPVLVKGIRVEKFELGDLPAAMLVLAHEILIRILPLGVLVKELHVRVRGGGVEVVIKFLDILAMVSLRARDTKEPLLDHPVLFIP